MNFIRFRYEHLTILIVATDIVFAYSNEGSDNTKTTSSTDGRHVQNHFGGMIREDRSKTDVEIVCLPLLFFFFNFLF